MNLLHISFNDYPSIKEDHSTKMIWKELMKDYDEYHVLGRAKDQKFHTEHEGKLWLHRMPFGIGNKTFAIEQFLLPYYIRKYHINIMITQCCLLGGVAGIICSRIFHIPIFVEIHGEHYFKIMDGKNFGDRILGKVIKWVYNHASAVRALNPKMKQMLLDRGIHSKIIIIQNRVNVDLFKPAKTNYDFQNSRVTFIAVGSYVERKGHLLLINLVKKLSRERKVHLILIGGGKLYQQYVDETKGWDNFTIYQTLKQEEIVKIMRNCDIFFQPSFSEAVPRTIIEAMAMGMPIIASDAGMTDGLIHDRENGLLFHVGDEKKLEQLTNELLDDSVLRRELGENAYKDAIENYEWNKNFEKYRAALRSLTHD